MKMMVVLPLRGGRKFRSGNRSSSDGMASKRTRRPVRCRRRAVILTRFVIAVVGSENLECDLLGLAATARRSPAPRRYGRLSHRARRSRRNLGVAAGRLG